MNTLTVSGTTYAAALLDVDAVPQIKQVFRGSLVTLTAPDAATHEAWINQMIVTACDLADDPRNRDLVETIYRDVERADLAAGRQPTA